MSVYATLELGGSPAERPNNAAAEVGMRAAAVGIRTQAREKYTAVTSCTPKYKGTDIAAPCKPASNVPMHAEHKAMTAPID